MKEFILLLLFGRSILLTPSPILIGPTCIELKPAKILHVINGGAALEIRIYPGTNGTPNIVNDVTAPKAIQNLYPTGTVTAELYRENGSKIEVINTDVGTGQDSYSIYLSPPVQHKASNSTVPVYTEGDKFTKISICSKNTLSNVQVYWQTAED